jgi:acetamidase/formamidase
MSTEHRTDRTRVALQPGKGKVDGKHYLPSTPETVLWGRLPGADTRPVLTVDPGVTITMDTVSHEGMLEDQGRDPEAFFGRYGVPPSEVLADARSIAASGIPHRFGTDGPHILTGPVHVRGAEPGDVLRVEVVSLHPRARYGVVSNRHGAGLLAGEFPEVEPPGHADADARHWQRFGTVTTFCQVERRRGRLLGSMPAPEGRKVRFPLAPFMGIMTLGTPGSGAVNSAMAGRYGGNLACRELVAGSRLYLPVELPGGLFAAGNPRYSQGNGMVAHAALEAPLRATFRISLLSDSAATACLRAAGGPFGETDTHWIPMGAHPDLTEAFRQATRSAVGFLTARLGLDRADALAYLSSAADFCVSQLVDDVRTVHCLLRRADFGEPPPPKTRLPRPGFTRSSVTHDAARDADAVAAPDEPREPAEDATAAETAPGAAVPEPAAPEPALPEPAVAQPPGVVGGDEAAAGQAPAGAVAPTSPGSAGDASAAVVPRAGQPSAGTPTAATPPLGTPPVGAGPGGQASTGKLTKNGRAGRASTPGRREPSSSEPATGGDPAPRDT